MLVLQCFLAEMPCFETFIMTRENFHHDARKFSSLHEQKNKGCFYPKHTMKLEKQVYSSKIACYSKKITQKQTKIHAFMIFSEAISYVFPGNNYT